jgi:hypothetical protein
VNFEQRYRQKPIKLSGPIYLTFHFFVSGAEESIEEVIDEPEVV